MSRALGYHLLVCLALSACKINRSNDASKSPQPVSLIGTWSLQTVLTETQPPDAPSFRRVVNISAGANNLTFTKKGKQLHLVYDNPLAESSYRHVGDSLFVYDSTRIFRGQLTELTPQQYVQVEEAEENGTHYTITTTYARTSLKRLAKLRRQSRALP